MGIERVLNQIYSEVSVQARTNNKNYKYDIARNFPHGHGYIGALDMEVFITALMEALHTEFPDCKIERVKTLGYENKVVENFIVIDWS
jgi:hypothetical protein